MFGSMNVLGCFLYVFGFSRTMMFLVYNMCFLYVLGGVCYNMF